MASESDEESLEDVWKEILEGQGEESLEDVWREILEGERGEENLEDEQEEVEDEDEDEDEDDEDEDEDDDDEDEENSEEGSDKEKKKEKRRGRVRMPRDDCYDSEEDVCEEEDESEFEREDYENSEFEQEARGHYHDSEEEESEYENSDYEEDDDRDSSAEYQDFDTDDHQVGFPDICAKKEITPSNPRLRFIVFLGSSVICNNDLEKINQENLRAISKHLQSLQNSSKFVVVHDAGSFEHFKGELYQPLVRANFTAARISVTSLNLEIVKALAKEDIPSIGLSPFSRVSQGNVASADITDIAPAIASGFIPVLHGDVVLSDSQGCTILGGDAVTRHLAEIFRPEYVVFLTNAFGVYNRSPSEPDAILLREIVVDEDGSWSVINPKQVINEGAQTKLSEVAAIAKLGIDVYLVKAGTNYALKALKGEVGRVISTDWLGTFFRPKN